MQSLLPTLLFALAACTCVAAARTSMPDVDLDSVDAYISFAVRSQLVSQPFSPAEEAIAWVENVRGVGNIWFASASGGWTPNRATNFSDASMELVGVQWVTAQQLIFSRRPIADVNMKARASGAPVDSATYVLSILAPYHMCNLSADGNVATVAAQDSGTGVYFARANPTGGASVWRYFVSASSPVPNCNVKSTRIFGVQRGSIDQVRVQPGSHNAVVAFTNPRGHHGFLGVWAQGADSIVWIDPSVETDTSPRWSPDGARLAWLRVRPPIDDDGYGAFDGNQGNRGPDFKVMVADLADVDRLAAAAGAGNLLEMMSLTQPRVLFVDEEYGAPTFGYGRRGVWFPSTDVVLFGTERLSKWLHLAKARGP